MDQDQINKAYKVKTTVVVRYADLDTLQHVNNASYLSYLEEARIDYIEKVLQFDKSKLEFGVVVARIEIDYLAPVMLEHSLQIYSRTESMGTKSFTFDSIFVANEDSVVAKAKVVLVCVDDAGNTISIPEEWRKQINQFEN